MRASARALLVLAAAAGLAGCSTVAQGLRPWENTTPAGRFEPALSTSPQCIAAAKRATYYCERVNNPPDSGARLHMSGQNADVYACNDAERDFYRYCR
jgi:hypothetical protein